MSGQERIRRIVVLGSPSVGKSSLTVQYVEDQFIDLYYPTIENTFTKIIKYHNQEYKAEIIDTAGQDEHSILNKKHSIGIHGYMLVYSITSRASLEICQVIRDKILNHTQTDWVPIVLIGNKSDLHLQREVTFEETQKIAKEWNCANIEASAKHNTNIAKAFELMLGEIEKGEEVPDEPKTTCAIM